MSKSADGITRLKYIAYCRSQMPPEEVDRDYEDFIAHAKNFLCVKTGKLFKDPVWDRYTDEEIIIEFFSHQFENEKVRTDFERELLTKSEDIDDWLVEQASKKVNPDELEDKIEFTPESIG